MGLRLFILILFICVFSKAENMNVEVDFIGINPKMTVQLRSESPVMVGKVPAGGLNIIINVPDSSFAGSYLGMITSPTQAFCIDITSEVKDGLYTLMSPSSAPIRLEEGLPISSMGKVRADWLGVLTNQYWNESYLTNSVRYASLQIAIWEIIFEGDGADDIPEIWNVSNGDFMITNPNAVISEANRILNQTSVLVGNNNLSTMSKMNLGVLSSDLYQDMLIRTDVTVAEPGCFWLLIVFCGISGMFRPRRKN